MKLESLAKPQRRPTFRGSPADVALAGLRRRPGLQAGVMVAPAGFWFLFFLIIPLLMILAMSFATRSTYGGVDWKLGFHNYLRFLEPLYLQILVRSVELAFLTAIITLVIAYPLAYYIAGLPHQRRNLYLMLVVIPFWTNLLIRTYAWIVLLRGTGVINNVLMGLHIIDKPLSLLYTPLAVLLGLVYDYLPFMVLPLYASIEQMDRSLLEAAQDLGANSFWTFVKVVLPLTMPGIVAGSILVLIPALGVFVIPNLMGGAKTVLIGNLIENQFKMARNWPFGSAASMVLMAMAMIMILVYVRLVGFGGDQEAIL
ncbi:MAG: ABC transporter permease [Bacillota bacterium]